MDNRPLVVHRDGKIYLIEKLDKGYMIEDELNAYTTLVDTPTNVHTYSLDEFSLWSASVLGYKEEDIIKFLENNSKNVLPKEVVRYIKETIKEFWTMELYVEDKIFKLKGNSRAIDKILDIKDINSKVLSRKEEEVVFHKRDNYNVRKILLNKNIYIIEKSEQYTRCNLKLKNSITLYRYQKEAVEKFVNPKNRNIRGRGVMIMPPGSGKTIVGLKIIELLKVNTLILIKSKEEYKHWLNEIEDKTNFNESDVGLNDIKSEKPICICTYNYASEVISDEAWGLIIYDDANSLPTPKRKKTAFITSKFKLAMDSILWRSDDNERLIFKIIGPKVFNLTLRKLEQEHYQIKVKCYEVKIPFKPWDIREEKDYNHTVSKNFNKIEAYKYIDNMHKECQKILVTHFIKIAGKFHEDLRIPLCDGNSDYDSREETLNLFNNKDETSIVITDIFENQHLENIDILVALSYHGKSVREEYLRIGKLKSSNIDRNITGYYYALVSQDTKEEEIYIARRNQMLRFGYDFKIITLDELRRGEYEI